MNYNTLLRDFIRVFVVMIYPLCHLYGYFVLIGLFCLTQKKFEGWITILVFFFYHILAAAKVVYYMKLLINEGFSTLEIFPHLPSEDRKLHLRGINIFIQQDITSKNLTKVKSCHICKTYKPPRAHHCKFCNRCYLKYDHHCLFLDTCIGFHNYKFFYQFIFLNICSSIFYLLVLGIEYRKLVSTNIKVNYLVILSFAGIQLCFMTFWFVFHTSLISLNETVVENRALDAYIAGDHSFVHIFQEGPITNYSKSTDRRILNPYNLSISENWKQVFGENWYDWFKLSITSRGDGTIFPVNYTDYEVL